MRQGCLKNILKVIQLSHKMPTITHQFACQKVIKVRESGQGQGAPPDQLWIPTYRE